MRITIVGAGFSGATLATALATSHDTDVDLCLVGVASNFGCGVAYGDARGEHLLNTRAGQLGADAAKRDEAKAIIRSFVAARSSHAFDKGQADRICRAIHRAWMCAVIARHPRAGRFGTLTDALRRGRFTEAQMSLAKRLVAEVGA